MKTLPFVSSLLPAFFAVAIAAQSAAPIAPPAGPATASTGLRIAVVGASASQGFELLEFLGSGEVPKQRIAKALGREPATAEFDARTHSIGLATLLTELRAADAPPITDLSDKWMFMAPAKGAKQQLRKAADREPQLVLALDFVFWFGYGSVRGVEPEAVPAARVDRLRAALVQCDEWLAKAGDCRLVLGDFPDCHDAAKEMISDDMRPDAATLTTLNATLREWAAGHPNVRIFPLGGLLETMRAGQVLGADGHPIDEAAALQFDRLHPTRCGMAIVARELVTFVHKEFPALPMLADAEAVAKRVARP